jgi:GDP-L-fucose synthase
MEQYDEAGHINVGSGIEVRIAELAELVRDVVYPGCRIEFDSSRPDGTPRKLLDTSRLRSMGWTPTIDLRSGIESTYQWFLSSRKD